MEGARKNPQALLPGLSRFLPESLRERLSGQGGAQAVVGNICWQIADHLLRMGVGLLVGIWVARYLGPEQFGLLSYVLAFVALFSPLAMLGLDDIVVRNLARDAEEKDAVLGTTFLLRLVGAVLSLLAAIAVIVWLRPDDPQSWWLVGIIAAGALFQPFFTIELWFNARVQARYPALAKSAAFLLCALGKVVLILAAAPLVAFAWIGLIEIILGAAGLVIAFRANGHRVGAWSGRRHIAVDLLKDCWPLLFSCIIIVVYLRIDQIMLGEMLGSEAVGVYSVAVRLAEVWFFLSAAFYWSFLPGLVAARAKNEELFYQRLQKYYNLMTLLAYVIAIPVMFIADWLVPALFGQAYAGAGPILAVLIWANLFIYLENARSAFFNVMNWYRLHLVTVALGAGLNVLLNFLLIPRYGGLGAALSSCFAYWFAAHGSCFLYKPLHRTGWMLTKAIFFPKVW